MPKANVAVNASGAPPLERASHYAEQPRRGKFEQHLINLTRKLSDAELGGVYLVAECFALRRIRARLTRRRRQGGRHG